jgi:hypothetical protein
MMHARRYMNILPLLLVALWLCCENNRIIQPEPPSVDTVTVVFRDRQSPDPDYAGTRDAILKNGNDFEITNGNFGNVKSDTLGTVYLADNLYERRLIVRFDISSVTGCSWVYSADLSISIVPDTRGTIVLEAYEVDVPDIMPGSWLEGSGIIGKGVSYHSADGVVPWSNPGGDYVPKLLDAVTVSGDSVVTFSLPGALAYHWILYPGENHGVIIKSRYTDEESYRIVRMRESDSLELRPALRIEYLKGNG